MRFKTGTTIVLLLVVIGLSAVNDKAGTTGFAFLKSRFGTRSTAMGQAYTGLSDDADAVFYNVSGLLNISSSQASASYVSYFDGINCGSAIYVAPINRKSAAGVFCQFLSATEDRTLMNSAGNYAGTDGTFGMSNILIGLAYAYDLMDAVDFGVAVKYLREDLDDHVGSALVADFSLMHQTPNPKLRIGAAIKNVGTQIEYYSDEEYDGRNQIISAGFRLIARDNLLVTGDLNKPLEGDIDVNLGTEFQIHERFALRAGYKTKASDWKTGGDYDSFAGISGGFGLNWKQIDIDYAIASYGDLGFINQIALSYKF